MDPVAVFFDATPWALPGTLVGALVMLVAMRPLAERFGVPRAVAWFFGTVVVGYISVTATPSSFSGHWEDGNRVLNLGLTLPSVEELTTINPQSLNILLGGLLGLAVGLFSVEAGRWAPVWCGLGLIVGVEVIQCLLPILGRSGFLLDDVVLNLLGYVPGLVLAVVGARVFRSSASRAVGL